MLDRGNAMADQNVTRRACFLSTGWWLIHVFGIAAVYALGHILWR
jgi:hypothetical protein